MERLEGYNTCRPGLDPGSMVFMNQYYVYILASNKKGTLYIGVTNDLDKRILAHKENLIGGFTKKYSVKRLVYFEVLNNSEIAISREKQLKRWRREWKLELIEKFNPSWEDLFFKNTVDPGSSPGRQKNMSLICTNFFSIVLLRVIPL